MGDAGPISSFERGRLALAHMGRQVDGGHAEGANGGRGQVDHQHAEFVQFAAVLGMDVGGGGVEGDLHAVGEYVRQQAIHAFGGDFHAHLGGTFQAVGVGVDADHPHRL